MVNTDKGRISIEWLPAKETVISPVDRYIVEMSVGDGQRFTEVGKVVGTTCHFDANGLTEGEKYNFRIKAENQAGTSGTIQLEKPAVASSVGERTFLLFSSHCDLNPLAFTPW